MNYLQTNQISKSYGVRTLFTNLNISINYGDKIALIAPNAKINIIKNYEVIKKVELVIPDEIKDTLQCINPMCITNKEHVPTHFYFIDKKKRLAKCHYCERICKDEDLMLK